MVFSSLLFVFLFLALNLVSQAALRGARQKNIAMLLFSLVFFSWAGPRYVVLLLLDTALCWFFAICIEREPQRKKLHLSLCVALVLLVLGIFKYTGFLMGNLQSLFGWPEVIPQIVLPIGISFYTFQLISYVVDVYRGEVRAQKKYWILLLYASLFHQCIAGPIVRYRDVAQDLAKRQVHAEEVSRGISRFTVGLAKKAVLANSVAVLADRWLPMTTEGLAKIPTAGLWLGGLCYMLQIYLDFSAYSDMAIGMGLMCGFHYKENFNYPYIASSVTDFWRRWHISLSTFFRDYVYIPLGGNRRGKGRQLLNLFIVWGLTCGMAPAGTMCCGDCTFSCFLSLKNSCWGRSSNGYRRCCGTSSCSLLYTSAGSSSASAMRRRWAWRCGDSLAAGRQRPVWRWASA